MTAAKDIAKYLITLTDWESGDFMSNLKLQKLLYYAQGVSLVWLNRPLFPERIEAWQHGPVCRGVYHEYKTFGGGPIPFPQDFDPCEIPEEEREVLDEVYTAFGQFSAWRLREMTHDEPPWRKNYREGAFDVEIPHADLRDYFETVVEHGEAQQSSQP